MEYLVLTFNILRGNMEFNKIINNTYLYNPLCFTIWFFYSILTAYREADTPRTQTSHDTTQAILVDNPDQALYLQMGSGPETQAWKHDLRGAATNSGPLLVDQQLTRDEIPTLVEKCLNFVFTHGEWIYRTKWNINSD